MDRLSLKANMTKSFSLLLCLVMTSCGLFEARTGVSDTHTFFSSSINTISTIPVYYPENYGSATPVIYLLNGWGTDAYAWGSGMDLAQQAFDREIIIVSMSAGAHTYTNDYQDPDQQYEDYVMEVVAEIEDEYGLELEYTQRALCGISNGGGGVLFILSEHSDTFSACGSLSGTYYTETDNYSGFENRGLRFDVGREDTGLISTARWVHDRLNQNRVEHEYYEHEGNHSWTFWKKYAPKQFDFLQAIISGE